MQDLTIVRPLLAALSTNEALPLSNEERLKLWRALSDLFLDTEIDDATYKYIARTIKELDLTLSVAETILWHEVYPVLESNLRSVAGVWDGWPDEWLLKHISVCEQPSAIMGEPDIIKEIKSCWSQVVSILASENA